MTVSHTLWSIEAVVTNASACPDGVDLRARHGVLRDCPPNTPAGPGAAAR